MKKTLLIITLFITGVCLGQTYQLAEEFYENGLPKAIKTYKVSKGKIELVKAITLHENGQKEKEGTYKDGKLDGKWTTWYENGQKEYEGTYKNGELDGKWTFFNEDGSIKDDMDEDEEDDWGEGDENETEPPGPAPPGKVWSPEHGHWHDAP